MLDLTVPIQHKSYYCDKSIHYYRNNDRWIYWWNAACRKLTEKFYNQQNLIQVYFGSKGTENFVVRWKLLKDNNDNILDWTLCRPVLNFQGQLQVSGRSFSRGQLINVIGECKGEINSQTVAKIEEFHSNISDRVSVNA